MCYFVCIVWWSDNHPIQLFKRTVRKPDTAQDKLPTETFARVHRTYSCILRDARLDMKTHSIIAFAEFCLLNTIFSTLYLLLTYFDPEHLLGVAYSAEHVRESH